jgi:hypothetical protein
MARDVQTLRTARSKDGTAIAFERGGDGPALILLGGALSSGVRNFPPFVELARLLEPRFTVYRFDRRLRRLQLLAVTHAARPDRRVLPGPDALRGG